nr:hypothetical protein Iba_chr12fCG12470 [Ipomoea batatas]
MKRGQTSESGDLRESCDVREVRRGGRAACVKPRGEKPRTALCLCLLCRGLESALGPITRDMIQMSIVAVIFPFLFYALCMKALASELRIRMSWMVIMEQPWHTGKLGQGKLALWDGWEKKVLLTVG